MKGPLSMKAHFQLGLPILELGLKMVWWGLGAMFKIQSKTRFFH